MRFFTSQTSSMRKKNLNASLWTNRRRARPKTLSALPLSRSLSGGLSANTKWRQRRNAPNLYRRLKRQHRWSKPRQLMTMKRTSAADEEGDDVDAARKILIPSNKLPNPPENASRRKKLALLSSPQIHQFIASSMTRK